MRWKAPSSLRVPRCSGCATASRSSTRRSETGELAQAADPEQQVYLVPAFVGLGAPYWKPEVRGALFGLTRATGPKELARAALEAVCYQTRDLLEAMRGDWGGKASTILRVDGGMVASDWTMQCLADILDAPVDRPQDSRNDGGGRRLSRGARRQGFVPQPEEFAKSWKLEQRFSPKMPAELREQKYAGWKEAMRKLLS